MYFLPPLNLSASDKKICPDLVSPYGIYPKYSDKEASANNVHPDQMS